MFQFRRFPSYTYLIQYTITEVCSVGLLHSDISGSLRTYRSPKLFAVNYVLHRLPMPRHSPCALISFTICFSEFSWLLKSNTCSFYPIINHYRLTRSILICITLLYSVFKFLLFCPLREQISTITFIVIVHIHPLSELWWAQMDSNHRPHAYQACALTTWAMRPFYVWWRWGGSNSWPPACKAGALPAELHPHAPLSSSFPWRPQNWTTFSSSSPNLS